MCVAEALLLTSAVRQGQLAEEKVRCSHKPRRFGRVGQPGNALPCQPHLEDSALPWAFPVYLLN